MNCRCSYRYCITAYDQRHEVCSDSVGNPKDRFAHDAAHIQPKFFQDLCNVSKDTLANALK